jgi:hypothetical protein
MKDRTINWLIFMMVILIIIAVTFLFLPKVKAEIYVPSDSILLTVGTVDSTLLTVANADSIWFYWGRVQGTTFTLADSVKITSSFRTGGYAKKIRASAWAGDSTGSMYAQAIAYKSGKTGIKTWSWISKTSSADSMRTYQIVAKVITDSSVAKIGTSRIWSLRGLHIRGTVSTDTAVVITTPATSIRPSLFIGGQDDDGYAVKILGMRLNGTAGAAGLRIDAGAYAPAMHVIGNQSNALYLSGGAGYSGLYAKPSSGNANGIEAIGSGTGSGIHADGGSGGGHGLYAQGGLGTAFVHGHGIYAHGGDSSGTGLYAQGEGDDGHGIVGSAGGGGYGSGIYGIAGSLGGAGLFGIGGDYGAQFAGSNSYGLYISGGAGQSGMLVEANTDGDGVKFIGAGSGSGIMAQALGTDGVAIHAEAGGGSGTGFLVEGGQYDIVGNIHGTIDSTNKVGDKINYALTIGEHQAVRDSILKSLLANYRNKGSVGEALDILLQWSKSFKHNMVLNSSLEFDSILIDATPTNYILLAGTKRGTASGGASGRYEGYVKGIGANDSTMIRTADVQISPKSSILWGGAFGKKGDGTNPWVILSSNTEDAHLDSFQISYSSGNTARWYHSLNNSVYHITLRAKNVNAGDSSVLAFDDLFIFAYPDSLAYANVDVSSLALQSSVDDLEGRLTAGRADNLDNLDTTISSRSSHSASDVKALLGDTLSQILLTIDSILYAQGYDADSTLLTFLRYIRNNQNDYKANVSGLIAKSDIEDSGLVQIYIKDAGDTVYVKNPGGGATAYGFGVNQVEIITKQSTDSVEIVGATIQILNNSQTSTIGILPSNSSGSATFALDSDTFKIRMYKPGWQFTVPETLIVLGDTSITYFADPFDPGSAPSPDLCHVWGEVYDISNLPVEGAKAEVNNPTVPLRYGNTIISPFYKSTTTDSTGRFYFDLYPSADLTPAGSKYEFMIYVQPGKIVRVKTEVPDSTNWQLQW